MVKGDLPAEFNRKLPALWRGFRALPITCARVAILHFCKGSDKEHYKEFAQSHSRKLDGKLSHPKDGGFFICSLIWKLNTHPSSFSPYGFLSPIYIFMSVLDPVNYSLGLLTFNVLQMVTVSK